MASVRVKVLALVLPVVALGFVVSTGLSVRQVTHAQTASARQQGLRTAQALAGQVARLPTMGLQAATSLAAISAGFHSPDRAILQQQASAAARQTPGILDVYVCFDSGQAPGRDADWRGKPGMSGTGRFYTLYRHTGPNSITPEYYPDKDIAPYDSYPWRALPMRLLRPVIIEPAYDPTQGLTVAASAPILKNGAAIGVAGIDFAVSDLSKTLGSQVVGRTGHVLLLSGQGLVMGAPAYLKLGSDLGTKTLTDVISHRPGGSKTAAAALLSRISGAQAGSGWSVDPFSGQTELVSWAKVASSGWTMLTFTPSAEVNQAAHSLRTRMLLIAALSMLIIGLVLWYGVVYLIRPLGRLRRSAVDIAEGKIDLNLPTAGSDEFGQLATAFSGMVSYLRSCARHLERIASGDLSQPIQLASADDELGKALLHMQTGLSDTIGSVAVQARSLATAADDLSRQSDVLGAAATRAKAESAAAASGSTEFSQAIQEISRSAARSTELAADGQDAAARMTDQLARLAESSAGIETVVGVIDALAAQTRLLALNATIEAARAGSAGQGFGVVAGEVKLLAQSTTQATLKVTTRVTAIGQDVQGTIEAIREITATMTGMESLQNAIAAAVEEQSVTTGQVSSSVRGVAAAVADTESGVQANRDLIQVLENMSTDLNSAVSRFHTQPHAAE